MTSEQTLMKSIQAALSGAGCRAFRTNVGQGWTGSKVIHHPDGSVTKAEDSKKKS
jgi:hypothetical protein